MSYSPDQFSANELLQENEFHRMVDNAKRLGAAATERSEGTTSPEITGTPDLADSEFGDYDTDATSSARPMTSTNSHRQIGPYKLLQQIGEGGMGSVWMAEQEKPVRRRVALKVIKTGMDSKEVIARFEAERQALAMMDHQNIAKVLDAGMTDDGRPYFAMELVQGIPFNQYCDQNKLSLRERLELFVHVCNAVQHAHQKGIIHRDLKPSNVLVTPYDGKPVAKVIDFGLAKALQHQTKLSDKTFFTEIGQVMGTFQYMSPEQAENALDVDTRTDIYSLGVMLYELITGSTPLEAETIKTHAYYQILQLIKDREPPTPSKRLSESGEAIIGISAQRKIEPQKLQRILRGELDWIVMKALEKDRTRRYETANGFALDIERYLTDEPVVARPPSAGYRLRKTLRKHRVALAAAAGVTVLVIAAIIGTLAVARQQQHAVEATRLVERLLDAGTSRVDLVIADLQPYRAWATDDLVTVFRESPNVSVAKLHAALALLGHDDSMLKYLGRRLLTVEPAQFAPVRDLMRPHAQSLVPNYWAIVEDQSPENVDARFQAACALATYDRENAHWQNEEFRTFVAEHLVGVRPSELLPWTNALRPVKDHLLDPITKTYSDPAAGEQVRSFATDTLADYASDDAEKLFELLADADERQFKPMFDQLDVYHERVIQLGKAEVNRTISEEASEADKEALAMRQANAAVMLLRMNAAEQVWPLLKHSPDPRVRSYIIHWVAPRGGDPRTIIARYNQETDVSIKRALLLCLGEFELADSEEQPLIKILLEVYRSDPDAGLHSAAEWLLRQWGQGDKLAAIDKQLPQTEEQLVAAKDKKREWYINGQGQTFVIVDAGEFQMGSPEAETDHQIDETLHRRKIGRRIAISTKEVTKEQWRAFSDANDVSPADNEQLNAYIRSDDSPMTDMTWYEATHYCNWLSEQEGIPDEQWCYEKNEKGEYGPGMKAKHNFWELTGYRLPTEAEWEFACRAGSSTNRYYGMSEALLPRYAWYLDNGQNRTHPVASLKPNDFGLFDMQGNVLERCYDAYVSYPVSEEEAASDSPSVKSIEDTNRRVLRGGTLYGPTAIRSADRFNDLPDDRYFYAGFRPARTFRRGQPIPAMPE